jgi:hypothetical protein
MVQVDVFWAYGIGAGFAVAASHQLVTGSRRPLLQEPQAVSTLLYCGLLFAPSGAWLLWAFPSWETMQVADTHAALPAWLVALFAITNVSQGLLGFWVARRLIQRGRAYAAFLQAGLGYLGMFFILVHGWDGTGYRRFFSPDQAAFGRWQADGGPIPIARWFGSPVALTLYGMGAVLIPVMVAGLAIGLVAGIVGLGLGTAIVASALVNLTGWWIGVPLAAAVTWLVVTRRRTGLAHLLFRRLALSG